MFFHMSKTLVRLYNVYVTGACLDKKKTYLDGGGGIGVPEVALDRAVLETGGRPKQLHELPHTRPGCFRSVYLST